SSTPRPPKRPAAPAAPAAMTQEAAAVLSNARGLTALANRIKGLGQMSGATVEIALVRLANGRQIMVAGINSSARWTARQLAELKRLGIEVAPQVLKGMKNAPHAEENIAAHVASMGGRAERWSRGVVGNGSRGSYVCTNCQNMVQRIGGVIEPR
ncbi:MAG: hypothetical protein ACOYXT_01360, partial [Bacteroidota bacterium]